jgi:hypothetical protein
VTSLAVTWARGTGLVEGLTQVAVDLGKPGERNLLDGFAAR